MPKIIIKLIFIILGIGLIYFAFYAAIFLFASGIFDKTYSSSELVENFNEKKNEIYELKNYFKEIVPKNKQVEIEFESDNKLFRFGIISLDSIKKNPIEPRFLEWDLNTNTPRIDSIIKTLGWTRQTLNILKKKLDHANCIQIESGEPTKIGFQRSGMGMYFFNIFDKPITDSVRNDYATDSCTYLLINSKLVLEYESGVLDGQCFFKKKE